MRKKLESLENMTNISAGAAVKNQGGVGSRTNGVRLSTDIEDAIEKLGRLRLERNHRRDAKRPELVEIERREECRTKLSEESIAADRHDSDNSHNSEQHRDRGDNLIERGPIKSRYFSPARDQPYWTTVATEHSRAIETSDTLFVDYDKTVEQILGDKEYGETLNACLDQLQGLDKTYWSCYGDEKSESLALASGTARDQIPLTSGGAVEDESVDDLLLLESVLCGAFQAAQHATEDNGIVAASTGPTTTYPVDSLYRDRNPPTTSGSGSRESSRAQSPAAVVPNECPRTGQPCFGQSPVGSPLVTTTTTTTPSSYRPSQIFPYSSSTSSSSSNHSFGDTPSPNGSGRATFDSRIAGRFLDHPFDNFPLPTENSTSGAVGNVDNSDLWSKVVEELVNGLEGEKAKRSVSRNTPMDGDARTEAVERSVAGASATQPSQQSAICSTQRGRYTTQRTNATTKTASAAIDTRSNDDYAAVNADSLSPCRKTSDHPARKNVEPDFSALFHSFDHALPSPDIIESLCFDDFKTKRSTTLARDDFDIPKMVACFESRARRRCNSDRTIMPWPSLNLPSVKASDRLKEKLSPKQVEKAMISLLKRSVEELAEQDKDGDTTLMCLVGNPDELVHKLAYLVPLVERLSAIPASLTAANDRGEDALYLAALNCPQFPYVAGYLAATMLEKGIDVSQLYYHTRGDTLIHSIAARGDSHVETLAELLALRTVQGNAVFDLSKRNYDGKTALHVAVESHDPLVRGISSVATVKLLLKHGADPRIKETKCGDTALHVTLALSCDPALVKVLLNASTYDLVNAINYNHDTAMHVAAAASSTVSPERLSEVCWLLTEAGARASLLNRQGKAPLALVSPERKDAVRRILCKRL